MFLAYMDESGNTGRKLDADQPMHLIGCILVRDNAVRELEDALRTIAEQHFGASAKQDHFELHGADLFMGNGVFKGVAPATRIAAAEAVIDACAHHVSAFGYAAVDKRKSIANDHPHRIAFQMLVERLDTWLQAREDYGLIIADEQKEVEADIIADFDRFKRFQTDWGYVHRKIERIIDTVHFVRSHQNMLMQACDLLTYFTLKRIVARERQQQRFEAEEAADWAGWLAAHQTRSEEAVSRLAAKIGTIELFRAKIWPKK